MTSLLTLRPAVNQRQDILLEQAFIGGCAMSPEAGLTGFDYADCEFKKVTMAQSSQIIVGLTTDKIPAVARFSVAKFRDISTLVAEKNAIKRCWMRLKLKRLRLSRSEPETWKKRIAIGLKSRHGSDCLPGYKLASDTAKPPALA